jgi:hypothetical protein
MELFGRWNWWLSDGDARPVRVPPRLGEPRPTLRLAGW